MTVQSNPEFWKNRRVCVTGGAGFLGSFVQEKLRERGATEIYVPRIEEYDLVKPEDIQRMYDEARSETWSSTWQRWQGASGRTAPARQIFSISI